MLFFHCLILLIAGSCFNDKKTNPEVIAYRLGTTKLELHKYRFEGPAPLSIVHLHDNEVTALKAAETVLEESGGTLLTLKNREERLLTFQAGGRGYLADPNRIFTLSGRRSTLQLLSRYNKGAAVQLLRFANFFVQQIEPAATIVGVHNNTAGKYSIQSYARGGSFSGDAKETHINPQLDPDDFYITTDRSLFEKLKWKDFNVVLQHETRAADDGSLSIYYGRRKVSYVNVEAEHGHLEEQVLMLAQLREELQ